MAQTVLCVRDRLVRTRKRRQKPSRRAARTRSRSCRRAPDAVRHGSPTLKKQLQKNYGHEIPFPSQRNSNPGDQCFADGHGNLRALVANGLLVLGQVAHESRLIGPIEVITTGKTSPNHRPASRMGNKSLPLCPWANSRVHLSNPRLRSTRRLIRPLDPTPDRQGFYSCDRIKRLLVGQRSVGFHSLPPASVRFSGYRSRLRSSSRSMAK